MDIKVSDFDERVKKEGRILIKDDVLYLSHSASSISFFTDARVVEAVLTTDTGVGMENLPLRIFLLEYVHQICNCLIRTRETT